MSVPLSRVPPLDRVRVHLAIQRHGLGALANLTASSPRQLAAAALGDQLEPDAARRIARMVLEIPRPPCLAPCSPLVPASITTRLALAESAE